MVDTRLWLPPASRVEAEAVVAKVVEPWLKEWFATASQPAAVLTPVSSLRRIEWRGVGMVVAGVEEAGWARLGHAICAGGEVDNARDRPILAGLGQAAVDHLVERLEATLPIHGFAAREPGSAVQVGFLITAPGQAWSMALGLDEEVLHGLRRSCAGACYQPALGSRREALAGEPCALALHLGSAMLTAGDLASLTSGDVIAFDRCAADPAPLLVDGKRPLVGAASISTAEEFYRLTVTTPPSTVLEEIGSK